MNTLKYTPPLRQSHLALCLLLSMGVAHAGIGDTPFSLSLGQSFRFDSNADRTEEGRSDTVSTTSVGVTFEKAYGRQNYSGVLQALVVRNQKVSARNYQGFIVNLNASSEVGRSSMVELDYDNTRSLQDPEFQGTSRNDKKIVTSQVASINVSHGLYGRWKLIGNLAFTNIDYDTSPAENRDSRGFRAGVRYSPTDLLYFESGIKRTQTDYDQLRVITGPSTFYIGDRTIRTDLDFQSGWVVTGLSNFYGQINWTDEKHESLATGQAGDPARDYTGVTGSLSWNYTPRGKISYSVKLSRDTNNSGGFSNEVRTTTQDRLNTSLSLNATWQATHKISVNAGVDLQRIEEDERQQFVGGAPLTEKLSGLRKELSLTANYKLSRSWLFSCELSNTNRDRTIFNSGFVSNSMSCSGNFLMD